MLAVKKGRREGREGTGKLSSKNTNLFTSAIVYCRYKRQSYGLTILLFDPVLTRFKLISSVERNALKLPWQNGM